MKYLEIDTVEFHEIYNCSIKKQFSHTDSGYSIIEKCFPPSLGNSKVLSFSLGRGIDLKYEEIYTPRDIYIGNIKYDDDDSITASFHFEGYHSHFSEKGRELSFPDKVRWHRIPGETYASFFPADICTRVCHLTILPHLLDKENNYFPRQNDGLSNLILGGQNGIEESSIPSYLIDPFVRSIISLSIQRPWDWMVFESRMLDMVSQLLDWSLPPINNKIEIPGEEREKLQQSREVMIRDLCNPPSIEQLSRELGLNEFKLKKGFKLLFGQTIFEYLREVRLNRAVDLLKSGQMNVTETALTVGYSNPGAFSVAFQKRFGESPIHFRKKIY